jgi:hypothetical protein
MLSQMVVDKVKIKTYIVSMEVMMNKIINREKRLELESTKKKLIRAQEEYLFARGWKKIGEKHFTPTIRVAYVDPGDQLFLKFAMEAQEAQEDV